MRRSGERRTDRDKRDRLGWMDRDAEFQLLEGSLRSELWPEGSEDGDVVFELTPSRLLIRSLDLASARQSRLNFESSSNRLRIGFRRLFGSLPAPCYPPLCPCDVHLISTAACVKNQSHHHQPSTNLHLLPRASLLYYPVRKGGNTCNTSRKGPGRILQLIRRHFPSRNGRPKPPKLRERYIINCCQLAGVRASLKPAPVGGARRFKTVDPPRVPRCNPAMRLVASPAPLVSRFWLVTAQILAVFVAFTLRRCVVFCSRLPVSIIENHPRFGVLLFDPIFEFKTGSE